LAFQNILWLQVGRWVAIKLNTKAFYTEIGAGEVFEQYGKRWEICRIHAAALIQIY
jgi:hypothetical protein